MASLKLLRSSRTALHRVNLSSAPSSSFRWTFLGSRARKQHQCTSVYKTFDKLYCLKLNRHVSKNKPNQPGSLIVPLTLYPFSRSSFTIQEAMTQPAPVTHTIRLETPCELSTGMLDYILMIMSFWQVKRGEIWQIPVGRTCGEANLASDCYILREWASLIKSTFQI